MVKDKIKFFEGKARESATNIVSKKQQPVAAPRTKIGEKRRALKGFTKLYEIGLKSDRDALMQLQNTRLTISRLFNTILNETKGFKFGETLKVIFVKRKDDNNIYNCLIMIFCPAYNYRSSKY